MNRTSLLDEKQVSALRTLHFWRRNLMIAFKQLDSTECQKSRIAIYQLLKVCDHLEILFKLQNKVIYAATQDVTHSRN